MRGNCDTEVDQMVLEFPILADYAILYTGTRMIYATHGHVYHMENPSDDEAGEIFCCTDIPMCRQNRNLMGNII